MSDRQGEHYIIHIHVIPRWAWLPRWAIRIRGLRRQLFVVEVDPGKRGNLVSIIPPVKSGDTIMFTFEARFEDYNES